jgi:hypothetical protein
MLVHLVRQVEECLKTDRQKKPEPTSSPCDGPLPPETSPCVEYLQEAVTRLLMKNEAMRFELFAVRQKIAMIDQAVFGAGCDDLQMHLPLYLIGALRDLCRSEAAWTEPRTGPQPVSGNVIGFRSK